MAKLEAVDLNNNPEARDTFSKITSSRGWVSNLMRALAHAPEGLKQYSVLGHYSRYDTDLTEV
jgi:4-carboxymuconolactone decarboxylase